jgi:hypothetical protein
MNAAQPAAPLPALPAAEENPCSRYEEKVAGGKAKTNERPAFSGGRQQPEGQAVVLLNTRGSHGQLHEPVPTLTAQRSDEVVLRLFPVRKGAAMRALARRSQREMYLTPIVARRGAQPSRAAQRLQRSR